VSVSAGAMGGACKNNNLGDLALALSFLASSTNYVQYRCFKLVTIKVAMHFVEYILLER
jgi:hypothetical protein